MSRKVLSALTMAVAATASCLFSTALPPRSATAAPIERVMSTPTGWVWYTGVTASQLANVITTGNFRIVDLQADSSAPTFTAALVSNTGAYAKSWWWYTGQTVADVSAKLSANNARLISIAPYTSGGSTVFAVVMVPNTGTDAKKWYWWVGDESQIKSGLGAHPEVRLVELEPFAAGRGTNYAAIAIGNSGADADSWWWYLRSSFPGLASQVSTNKAQLLNFTREGGNFDSVMQGGSTAPWWFYSGVDTPTLSKLLNENGARLTQVRADFSSGNRTFDAIMINNSNSCTSRIIGIQQANGTGWNGQYLKQISGAKVTDAPVICAPNNSMKFEPASAIKVVIATYAMHLVQTRQAKLTDSVSVYDPVNFCNLTPIGTETLQNAITQMMQNSDNARTDSLMKKYGMATLNAYAHSIGMPNTAFNGYIDCPGAHNTLTLDDAAALYTGLAQHTILTKTNVDKLYTMMAGRNYDFSGTWKGLQTIAQQVAPAALPAAKLQSFLDLVKLSYKAGGYTWPGGIPDLNGQTEYGDLGIDGYLSLPYCSGAAQKTREYVFGFFHQSTASSSDQPGSFNAIASGAEPFREQLTTALKSWATCG